MPDDEWTGYAPIGGPPPDTRCFFCGWELEWSPERRWAISNDGAICDQCIKRLAVTSPADWERAQMRPVSAAHRALGDAIRAARQERQMSQEQLALEASLDRSYAGQVERGEKNLGFTNLLKIANALDLEPSELLARAEGLKLFDPWKLPGS